VKEGAVQPALGQELGAFRPALRIGLRWAATITSMTVLGAGVVPVLLGTAKPGWPLRLGLISAGAFVAFLILWSALSRLLGANVHELGLRGPGLWNWRPTVRWSEIVSVVVDNAQFLPMLRIKRSGGGDLFLARALAEDAELVRLIVQLAGNQNALSKALVGAPETP
jgi:hypothetical protein